MRASEPYLAQEPSDPHDSTRALQTQLGDAVQAERQWDLRGRGCRLGGGNRYEVGRCLGIRVAHGGVTGELGEGWRPPVSTFSHLRFPEGLAAPRSRDCSQ